MREAGRVHEEEADGKNMRQMGRVLHDLCQPLTTLQCRLEMATLIGTEQGYRDAVNQGLAECSRLAAAVGSMREIVRSAAQDAEVEEIGAATAACS
jgi:signal transduction histidine kinase